MDRPLPSSGRWATKQRLATSEFSLEDLSRVGAFPVGGRRADDTSSQDESSDNEGTEMGDDRLATQHTDGNDGGTDVQVTTTIPEHRNLVEARMVDISEELELEAIYNHYANQLRTMPRAEQVQVKNESTADRPIFVESHRPSKFLIRSVIMVLLSAVAVVLVVLVTLNVKSKTSNRQPNTNNLPTIDSPSLSPSTHEVAESNQTSPVDWETNVESGILVTSESVTPLVLSTRDELLLHVDFLMSFDADDGDVFIDDYVSIPMKYWDISAISDCSEIFSVTRNSNMALFNNPDVGTWNTSNCVTMASIFSGASSFNQDISGWDTSRVTTMESAFAYASAFAGNLSSWDTSRVRNMNSMFSNAYSFNSDISAWDTAQVDDMSSMFEHAYGFNQNLSSWNVAKVARMDSMFANAYSFNQDLFSFDASQLSSMSRMFWQARSFNKDLRSWDTSRVTNMDAMFFQAVSFEQDISQWNTSQVTRMHMMFSHAILFNQNISSWDVSKVNDMQNMFHSASSFNRNLCPWTQKMTATVRIDNMLVGTKCPFPSTNNTINYFCHACRAPIEQ